MKATKFLSICVVLTFMCCQKEKVINSQDEGSSRDPNVSTTIKPRYGSGPIEYYFIDGVETTKLDFPTADPTGGEEYVDVFTGDTISGDTIKHHFFSSYSDLVSWANNNSVGPKVLTIINRYDSLRDYAISSGEIDYFENNGGISSSMDSYLQNGPYIYSSEDLAHAKNQVMLFGFFKKDCLSGAAIPFLVYPFLNNFDNDVSFQQGVIAGVISLFDKTWFRDRMKTMVFVAFTNRSYCGETFNDRSSSIAVTL